jgi:acylpyruvate hydrolase
MHLVTLRANGRPSAGIVIGNDILDLAGAAEAVPSARLVPHSLRGLLEAGDEALNLTRRIADQAAGRALSERLRESGALIARDRAVLLPPIPDPGFILSCGMNYHAHLKEMKSAPPATPAAFYKAASALIGTGAAIRLPQSNPEMVDWEGEFCAVIGRPCYNVGEAEALSYVAGYTLCNDVSARDWVPPIAAANGNMAAIMAWEHNILGKQFPTFCPMGPAIVTSDEIADPHKVAMTTTLNGKVMQQANTDDLVFNIKQLIAYYSRFYLLRPGDVITTGSPSGVGYGRDPKVFMRAGDRVEVRGEGIGTLSNPVVAASS